MDKLNKLSVAKRLSVALLALVFLIAFIPTVQAKPLGSEMEVYFNPEVLSDPTKPIWVGYIHGDLEGEMTFWATGPVPAHDVGHDPDNPLGEWRVHFFCEDWEIITPDGTIKGIDSGCTVSTNWKFRMNGIVTEASGMYSNLVGHQVHMHGQITWDFGNLGESNALGPVIIT